MSGICFVCFLVGLKAKVTVMTKIKELGGEGGGGGEHSLSYVALEVKSNQYTLTTPLVKSVYFNHPFSQISIL